jgi:hypothetical protein
VQAKKDAALAAERALREQAAAQRAAEKAAAERQQTAEKAAQEKRNTAEEGPVEVFNAATEGSAVSQSGISDLPAALLSDLEFSCFAAKAKGRFQFEECIKAKLSSQ